MKMSELASQIKGSGSVLTSPPPFSPLPSFPSHSGSSNSQSGNRISPVVLLVIVILAIVFFVSGILHLLVRFLMKRPSFYSSVSQSNRQPENTGSDALQRQLQQLFRLHDSGLDQALIDALPVFYYKDIMGLKEPFDCAVCLCEFSDQDKLRLLPMCSHAFHISCIDTWLLSNSTCPLCRGSLLTSGLENQEFSLDYWRELSFGCSIDGDNTLTNNNNGHSFHYHGNKPTIMEESASERRVFSVRLGKFRNLNIAGETRERDNGETSTSSSSQLDARRCYSLGSYQYVVADSNLQVALSAETGPSGRVGGIKLEKIVGQVGNSSSIDGDVEGKRISRRNKGDSFSVSKIWLWSKKGRFLGSSETNVNGAGGPRPHNVILPLSSRDQIFH
uniref:RING-type E3 ubiquitin transferase n=1 Tax=Opuntia streptacantha TaxID=393608 RepID=A0A7C9DHN5_OPUST